MSSEIRAEEALRWLRSRAITKPQKSSMEKVVRVYKAICLNEGKTDSKEVNQVCFDILPRFIVHGNEKRIEITKDILFLLTHIYGRLN